MLNEIRDIVLSGRLKRIEPAVAQALDSGISSDEILRSMTEAMNEIGRRFQRNEIFVPEMLVSARTMQRGYQVIGERLHVENGHPLGKYIIGTVSGDLHDVGKNLVAMMLKETGFEVIDLGVDVPPERFIEALKANPDTVIVGLSSLLTTTMSSMGRTVKALRSSGLCENVKIMVGGAPITSEFAHQIGADAYTPNAAAAADCARSFILGTDNG